MKCLVIGNGRAGKRHVQSAIDAGLEVASVDPTAIGDGEHYESLMLAMCADCKFDYAVIATPPEMHLRQLAMTLGAGIPTLCEMPLCGLRELDAAANLVGKFKTPAMAAYNYRHHPALTKAKNNPVRPPWGWALVSENYRDTFPPWGLLLDHVSHAIDTVNWMSGGIESIEGVSVYDCKQYEEWSLWGNTATGKLVIKEKCWKTPHDRISKLNCAHGEIDIDANPKMFSAMWRAFLNGKCLPSLEDAFETQYWLGVVESRTRTT